MISTIIVDDEPIAREGLCHALSSERDFEVVGQAGDGPAAVELVRTLRPDVLFLDIELRTSSGFDVLAEAGETYLPAVVFVTAYDKYAVKAFDAHAVDYLLKPVNQRRFSEAVARLRACVSPDDLAGRHSAVAELLEAIKHARQGDDNQAPLRPLERFVVRCRDRYLFVRVGDVEWIRSAANYIELHTSSATHLVRATMRDVEGRLDSTRFVRVHRSAIVNLGAVKEVLASQHQASVVLRSGAVLPLGPAYRQNLIRPM